MAFSDRLHLWGTRFLLSNSKHASTRVREHESSDAHVVAAQAYLRFDTSRQIEDLINHEQALLRASTVKSNQDLVKLEELSIGYFALEDKVSRIEDILNRQSTSAT